MEGSTEAGTTQDVEELIALGDLLPDRTLRPLGGGRAVRVGPNRGRAQVLALIHPEPCEACISYMTSLQQAAELIRVERAEVATVVTPSWQDAAASLPLPAVIDDGVVSSMLSRSQEPVVTVADRFGQLFARFEAGPDHDFPTQEEILTTLLNIGISCPECGVPDVPCATVLPEWDATSGGMRLLQ